MSKQDLLKLREAINVTLNQPGAFFQLETLAEGVLSNSHGVADFQNISHTSKDTIRVSISEEGEEQVENNEILSLFHRGEIFHLVELNDRDKEWTAFKMDDPGWGSSILAPLFWLRGVEKATLLSFSHYQLSINMQRYIAKQPTDDARTQAKQTLENSMIGLSTQTLSCEVKCDRQGRIEWLSVIVSVDNASEKIPDSQQEQSVQTTISLSFIDSPPTIPKPDANLKFSAIEFINSTVEQAKQELSTKKD